MPTWPRDRETAEERRGALHTAAAVFITVVVVVTTVGSVVVIIWSLSDRDEPSALPTVSSTSSPSDTPGATATVTVPGSTPDAASTVVLDVRISTGDDDGGGLNWSALTLAALGIVTAAFTAFGAYIGYRKSNRDAHAHQQPLPTAGAPRQGDATAAE